MGIIEKYDISEGVLALFAYKAEISVGVMDRPEISDWKNPFKSMKIKNKKVEKCIKSETSF